MKNIKNQNLYDKMHKAFWKTLKDYAYYKTPIVLGTLAFFLLFNAVYYNFQLIMSNPIYIFAAVFLMSALYTIFQSVLILLQNRRRFDERSPFVIKQIFRNFHSLMFWALLNIALVIVLNVIEAVFKSLAKYSEVAVSILELGWVLLGFYVVPQIVIENKSVSESLDFGYDQVYSKWRKPFSLEIFSTKLITLSLLAGAACIIGLRALAMYVPSNYIFYAAMLLFSLLVSLFSVARSTAQYELYVDAKTSLE